MSDDEELGRVMVIVMAIGHVGSEGKTVRGKQGQRKKLMEWRPA